MPRRIDTQAVIDAVRLEEQASNISTPASGYGVIFTKTDGGLYHINAAGVVRTLTEGSYARVYHDVNQSLTSGVTATLAFNQERVDTDNYHDTVTNNSRLTVPFDGFYVFGTNVRFTNNNNGSRLIAFRLDGSALVGAEWKNTVTNASLNTDVTVVGGYYLSAGQYLEVRVFQDSSSTLNALANPNYSPEFFIARIS